MSWTTTEGRQQSSGDIGVPVLGIDRDGTFKFIRSTPEPDAFSTNELHVPASNTAAVITLPAAGTGLSHVIGGIALSYFGTGTLAGARLTIADAGETVFDLDFQAKGQEIINFNPPRRGRPNEAMVITLAAGGADVQGKLNLLGAWVERQILIGELDFSDENNSSMLLLI